MLRAAVPLMAVAAPRQSNSNILLKSNVGIWEKYRVTFPHVFSKNLLGQLHSVHFRMIDASLLRIYSGHS